MKITLIAQAADLEEEAVFQTALQSGTDIQTLKYARAIFFGPSYDARVSGEPEKACQASLHRSISCVVERIHCNALAVEHMTIARLISPDNCRHMLIPVWYVSLANDMELGVLNLSGIFSGFATYTLLAACLQLLSGKALLFL